MVSLKPTLTKVQDDLSEEKKEYCRYCKSKPDYILFLTQTQDYICESCHKQYDILISNNRQDLPYYESESK